MKVYRLLITMILCSMLSSLAQGAAPVSLPGISTLQTITSQLNQLLCPKNDPRQAAQIKLFAAASQGDLATVQQYISLSTDNISGYHDPIINPNYTLTSLWLTPLMAASLNGHTNIIKELLTAGANLCARDTQGNTALYHATAAGHYEAATVLMHANTTENSVQYFGKLLRIAIVKNRTSIARELIKHGADLNTPDLWGQTALAYAIAKNNAMLVQLLIDSGADIDFCTHRGDNAISTASWSRSSPIVMEMLLKAGVDPNHSDHQGNQALKIALANRELIVADLLLRYGAQPTDAQNRHLLTAMQKAFVKQRYEAVRAWLLSLEDNHDLPRDLSRLVATFVGLPKNQNLPEPSCSNKN